MKGSIYLVVYTIIWGCTLWLFLRKNEKKWNASSFITASYFVFALFAVIYYLFYSDNIYKEIKGFPLIYLYVMFLLGLRPVLEFDKRNYVKIGAPSPILFNALLYFFIFRTLVNVPYTMLHLREGLTRIMMEGSGAELYSSTRDAYVGNDGQVSNIFSALYTFLSPICIFLFFYYLTLANRKKWIIIVLIISIVVRILYSISNGQRTEPVMLFLVFFATFYLFKPYLEKKTMKRTRKITLISFIVLLIPFIALTNSRFSNYQTGVMGSVVSYAGQAPIIFDNYCLDAGGIRYGDRTAPEFKRLVGFRDVPRDEPSRRAKYPHLKVDASSFYTYIGDFVLDYGPIGAVVLFLIFSSVFVSLTKHQKCGVIPFHKLILVYFALSVCVQGGMYLFNYAHYGNYSIMFFFLLYLVFYIDYNQRYNDNRLIQ